jgi:hypothetical protein
MNVCLCSSFRNSAAYIDRYFEQVEGLGCLLAARQDRLQLILGYGDSTDNTGELLFEAASFACGALLVECNHGGPWFGPVVDAQRFRQLAFVANRVWKCVPGDADAVLWVESDLIWQPATLVALINDLEAVPAVAPMVMDGPESFYDVWAYRRRGRNFTKQPPYHRDLADCDEDLLTLESAGSCVAVRGRYARQLCFPEEDVFAGFCHQLRQIGGSVWLNRWAFVCHP